MLKGQKHSKATLELVRKNQERLKIEAPKGAFWLRSKLEQFRERTGNTQPSGNIDERDE